MTGSPSRYPLRPPRSTPESRRGAPPRQRTETRSDMLIERDVEVRTRAGRTVQADIYRPLDGDPVPPLIVPYLYLVIPVVRR